MHVHGKESNDKPSNNMKNAAKTELLSDDNSSNSADSSMEDYDSDGHQDELSKEMGRPASKVI